MASTRNARKLVVSAPSEKTMPNQQPGTSKAKFAGGQFLLHAITGQQPNGKHIKKGPR